jgi:integrase
LSLKDIGGGRYMVRVYNPHGKEYRRVVAGKRAATAHEADMRSKLNRATILDPSGSKVTLRTYAAEHLAARSLRPRTAKRYERELELHIFPAFGHMPLRNIRHTDVVSFQASMTSRYGAGYAWNVVVLLRSLLRAAALDGLLERNPAAGVKTPALRTTEQPMPSWSDVHRVVEVASPDVALAVIVGATTGLRPGEVVGLAVDDLSMLRRELTVRRQLHQLGGEHFFGPPKTPESERTIPMPDVLVDALAAHLAVERPAVSAPWRDGDVAGAVQTHRLVIGKGKPRSATSLANGVRSFAEKADVVMTPHGLRRLYTTTLLEAGVPLRAVDYLTGHRSQGMTLGVYAKVTPDALARAREAVSAAWDGPGQVEAHRAGQ